MKALPVRVVTVILKTNTKLKDDYIKNKYSAKERKYFLSSNTFHFLNGLKRFKWNHRHFETEQMISIYRVIIDFLHV